MIRADGFFVVCNGRVGLTAGKGNSGRIKVQFGAGGPHSYTSESFLRYATREEVVAAGLDGVGGNVFGEPKPAKRGKRTKPA